MYVMNGFSSRRSTTTCPNILLIVMDATRAKNLSCYGYQRPTTPYLDRFAERSVVYETAISPAGWSLPSHASIFTGLYPSQHGAHDQHKYLLTEYVTMAQVLRAANYTTLAFCNNPYVGPATGLNRGFDWFNSDFRAASYPLSKQVKRMNRKVQNGIAKILSQSDSGARYINQRASTALRRLRTEELPFFMFIHYEDIHAPYRLPKKYGCYLPDGMSFKQGLKVNQDPWKYLIHPDLMGERDFEILKALYDGAITYVDTRIAEILSWLEQLGILDTTMVIITADHGENLGDHQLMAHKYCLYDTLLHVPLIIHYPKGITPPGRVTHQVQTLDLFPTILAMLGDTSSETYRLMQGYDLLSSARHDFTLAEQSHPDITNFHKRFPGVDVSRFDRSLKMIRTDQHKYIQASDGRHELYDLWADPDELCNIIAAQPHIADTLDQRLAEWNTTFEVAMPTTQAPEFDDVVRDRLRALGYLE
jgi:arylsulfatase A-like enzyme